MITRILLLAAAIAAAATTASADLNLGANVPDTLPTLTDNAAKGAIEAYRAGRHAEGVELAKPLAEKGNADALFLLGFASETGRGSRISRETALAYYKDAAAAGHREAPFRRSVILLNSQEEADRELARELLEAEVRREPSGAGRLLGEAWLRGAFGGTPDGSKAEEWWKRASDSGDTRSIVLLARLYEGEFGFPEKVDRKVALDFYRRAAGLGDEAAIIPLAARLLNGDESLRDETEGREWIGKAVEKKQWAAYLALGDFEEKTKKAPEKALANYRKGAENGQPDCMLRLSHYYYDGLGGLEKDEKKGGEWLDNAVKAGSSMAAVELAGRLAKGEKPDPLGAYRLLLSAAKSGLPTAQNELGLLYLSGSLGVNDPAAALSWWSAAAKAGLPAAQSNLGNLHERGVGVPVNYQIAGQLYSRAATAGHPEATSGLARLYASGNGVERSLTKAWALATLALERGDEDVKAFLEELDGKLTVTQREEARDQLMEFKKPPSSKPNEATPAGGPGK